MTSRAAPAVTPNLVTSASRTWTSVTWAGMFQLLTTNAVAAPFGTGRVHVTVRVPPAPGGENTGPVYDANSCFAIDGR